MREFREQRFLSGHKVAHLCSRPRAAGEHAAGLAREGHQAGQTRSIQLDKLSHTRARVRFSVGRNKTCT